MKKKIMVACLTAVMALSICACSSEAEEEVKDEAEKIESDVETGIEDVKDDAEEFGAAVEQDAKDIEENAEEASDAAHAMNEWNEEEK